eukprot:TRINITY_DN15193_c0_g1_i1.p1 TRINITY_DN15193_c0_g1~~TRINITY_DN15193_c0_g1_i1.p1  ORF type:complete len:216 (+),score=21.12 TRINITY_DN15193_c0_g1_i1:464-1111(+)
MLGGFNGLNVIVLALLCITVLVGVLLIPQVVVLRDRVVTLEDSLFRVERQLALMHAYVQVKSTLNDGQVSGTNDINQTNGKSKTPSNPSTSDNNIKSNNNHLSDKESPPDLKKLVNLVGIAHEFEERLNEWSSRLSEVGKSLGDVQKVIQGLSEISTPNTNNVNLDLNVLMSRNAEKPETDEPMSWGLFFFRGFCTMIAVVGGYVGLTKLSVRTR